MKKLVIVLTLLTLVLCSACQENKPAVSPSASQATQAPTEVPTEAPTQTPDTQLALPDWSYDFKKPGDYAYDYQLVDQYVPMWYSNVIYNECCCFIKDGDSITAKLRFKPTRIISVRDWSLKKEYVEGVDFTFDAETQTFTWLEGSSIPYFTTNFLAGKNEDGTKIPAFDGYDKEPWTTLGYTSWGNSIYCVGAPLYEKQMHVTYEYDNTAFEGPIQEFKGDKLPKTMAKLLKGEKLEMLFYGDSIPVGCDSSSMYNRDPRQLDMAKLIQRALKNIYGSNVTLRNTAVGGTTTQWAKENVQDKVIKYKPDLVVLMTGGNDGDNTTHSKQNIHDAVKAIKAELPDCEIILMDTFVGNKDAGMATAIKPILKGMHDDIAAAEEGVVSVGIFDLHNYFLQGKNYIDFSGNGINHPNDYMIRIYTQQLLSAMVDFKGLAEKK